MGRCDRGADCKFSHEGPSGKPRQATPARSASSDSKNKRKPGRNNKKKGSRSPSHSKSPKGSRSPRSKGAAASTTKPTPAAVCLVASMLASVSQAMINPPTLICCPSVRFDDNPDVTRINARGDLRPVGHNVTTGKVCFPWGHRFEVDQTVVNDAALVDYARWFGIQSVAK